LSPAGLALDLRKKVLLDPPKDGKADSLFIVSGYASPGYAKNHLDSLIEAHAHKIEVTLLIGMRSNLDWAKREEYLNLEATYEDRLRVFYANSGPEVHSKLYAWFSGEDPVAGFSGSANYTSNGFPLDEKTCVQLNHVSVADASEIRRYFDLIPKIAIKDAPLKRPEPKHSDLDESQAPPGGFRWLNEEKTRVRISFLDPGDGSLPAKSGLNWEMPNGTSRRPFIKDPSERWKYDAAYLKVPKGLHRDKPDFLPAKGSFLTLLTDDNEFFYCKIQQDDAKAISTTSEKKETVGPKAGNRKLGSYLRSRLGVVYGELNPLHGVAITREDLERYGRTDYTLEKISDESYLFDFSVK
jgi:hypothetical protein